MHLEKQICSKYRIRPSKPTSNMLVSHRVPSWHEAVVVSSLMSDQRGKELGRMWVLTTEGSDDLATQPNAAAVMKSSVLSPQSSSC